MAEKKINDTRCLDCGSRNIEDAGYMDTIETLRAEVHALQERCEKAEKDNVELRRLLQASLDLVGKLFAQMELANKIITMTPESEATDETV